MQVTGEITSVREAAARWYVLVSEPLIDQSEAERFEAWLAESEQNRTCYAATVELMSEVDALVRAPEIATMLQDTRSRAALNRRSVKIWQSLAAAAVLLICLMTFIQRDLPDPTLSRSVLQTDRDEIRDFRLRDGSLLSLDAATRATVTFTSKARTIALERGQARFRVAHDVDRPFQVVVAARKVVATGTDFNIERLADRSIVTLLRGGVAVTDTDRPKLIDRLLARSAQSTTLRPGDRMDIPDTGEAKIGRVDVRNVAVWQRRQLLVDNEPLSQVVQRLGRYTTRSVILDDVSLESRRISGMFISSDPQAFAGSVALLVGGKMHVTSDGSIHISDASE